MNTTELIEIAKECGAITREGVDYVYTTTQTIFKTTNHLQQFAQRIEQPYVDTIEDLHDQIEQLREALQDLRDVASQCDSWESFPSSALEAADKVLEQTK